MPNWLHSVWSGDELSSKHNLPWEITDYCITTTPPKTWLVSFLCPERIFSLHKFKNLLLALLHLGLKGLLV